MGIRITIDSHNEHEANTVANNIETLLKTQGYEVVNAKWNTTDESIIKDFMYKSRQHVFIQFGTVARKG